MKPRLDSRLERLAIILLFLFLLLFVGWLGKCFLGSPPAPAPAASTDTSPTPSASLKDDSPQAINTSKELWNAVKTGTLEDKHLSIKLIFSESNDFESHQVWRINLVDGGTALVTRISRDNGVGSSQIFLNPKGQALYRHSFWKASPDSREIIDRESFFPETPQKRTGWRTSGWKDPNGDPLPDGNYGRHDPDWVSLKSLCNRLNRAFVPARFEVADGVVTLTVSSF